MIANVTALNQHFLLCLSFPISLSPWMLYILLHRALYCQEERSMFVRFTWGRSRLPRRRNDFKDVNFVVQLLDK